MDKKAIAVALVLGGFVILVIVLLNEKKKKDVQNYTPPTTTTSIKEGLNFEGIGQLVGGLIGGGGK